MGLLKSLNLQKDAHQHGHGSYIIAEFQVILFYSLFLKLLGFFTVSLNYLYNQKNAMFIILRKKKIRKNIKKIDEKFED